MHLKSPHFYIVIALLFLLNTALSAQKNKGFFNYEYDEDSGKILLEVPKDRGEFIYVNYLSSGLGSNDIGLDRGQIGDTRLVHFKKYGNKLLLIQNNLNFRANTDNFLEAQSVDQAFAKSILGSFDIIKNEEKETKSDVYNIDITSFIVRDAHHIAKRLRDQKQGSYKLDKNRSVVDKERCKSFPKNTEFEAIISFNGEAKGQYLRSVTASDENISLAIHHSFVELPDSDYSPRKFHPYCGYFPMTYKDYAAPIAEDMNQRYIYRHRLEKKNPSAAQSEAVEPIVYYIDAGCPEPVKSALMDGAAWWNQAFEAAGFIDGFQIKELPEGADPLDVRYNMIQWVHRSTRGWSYGASVSDPRTGEIIKGHVSLGSLRVRQDYLIMQAFLSPFGTGNSGSLQQDVMEQVALARLRQLAAHEVGHTIGLAHNFASSINDRASVMDYPHPKLALKNGELDYSDAYDTKIGVWDIRTIIYGYSHFEDGVNEDEALAEILDKTASAKLLFISDQDARPMGGANPDAHLWDNGVNVIEAFESIKQVRRFGLDRLGVASIPEGTPYSELEKLLVPVYMSHRYQMEAVSKLIGGVHYNYSVKGGPEALINKSVPKEIQEKAFEAMLSSLKPEFLNPGEVIDLIPPPAMGYGRTRESFKGKSGPVFDSYSAAAASSQLTLDLLMHPQRINRIKDEFMATERYLNTIRRSIRYLWEDPWKIEVTEQTYIQFIHKLIELAESDQLLVSSKVEVIEFLNQEKLSLNPYAVVLIEQFLEGNKVSTKTKKASLPPGSPIGCGHFH